LRENLHLRHLLGWALSAGIVALVTIVAWLAFDPSHMADAVMLYLLGVVVASLRLGRGPSLATALLSVFVFDFLFIRPHLGLVITDARHLVTFAVMLLVAVVINTLARRTREQAEAARHRERRTAALYEMSRDLGSALERPTLLSAAARHIGHDFDAEVVVLATARPWREGRPAPDAPDRLVVMHQTPGAQMSALETAAAQCAWRTGHEAGVGSLAFPQVGGLYLPLATSQGKLGVLAVFARDRSRLRDEDERRFLGTFAAQVALALERAFLAEVAEDVRLAAEAEKLRNALLSSVSHDLRTPLGAISGAASTLLALGGSLDEPTRRELLETVSEEADRLGRRVSNLLDMTRLEAGAVSLKLEWQPLEEVVGSALAQLRGPLAGRGVRTDLPRSLPPVRIDSVLVGQVLVNILENALKYSPPGSPVEVAAEHRECYVLVSVADRGPGIRRGEEGLIFERFHQSVTDRTTRGVGLGLSICRAIVDAHGGRIWAENRDGGGSVFRVSLPAGAVPGGVLEKAG
jgi:two-component system, OmpR family, sensor histidine kinase KdpD